ncbi:MAG: hypothetical protein RI909_1327, partial [Bacteroidota bacterium]
MHHEGEKRYDQQKFILKKAEKEKKYDAKIAATKNQRKITQLQYKKQQKSDALTKKIDKGNSFMQWGEAATVFDSASILLTKEKMINYLFTKGYFKSTVSFKAAEYK